MGTYRLSYNKEEISNIIGRNGKKLREFIKQTNAKISVFDGAVEIQSSGKLNEYDVINMLDAMAIGFSAREALLLRKTDYAFEKINLKARLRRTRRRIAKARMIGRKGEALKKIKQFTDCSIRIFSNTIGIIGKYENVKMARQAIEKFMHGKHHEAVYRWLRRESERIEQLDELTKKQLKEIEE